MNILATLVVLSLAAISAGAATSGQTAPPREMRSDCRRVQDAAGKIDTAARDMFAPNGVGLSYLRGTLTLLRMDHHVLGLANTRVYQNAAAVDPITGRPTDCNGMLQAIQETKHVYEGILMPAYDEAVRHCSAGPAAVGEACFKAAELAYKRHRFLVGAEISRFAAAQRAAAPICVANGSVGNLSAEMPAEPCSRLVGGARLCDSLGRGLRDLDKNLHRARADDLEGLRDSSNRIAASGVVMILRRAGDGVHALRSNPSTPNNILFSSGSLILAAKKSIAPVKDAACDEAPGSDTSH